MKSSYYRVFNILELPRMKENKYDYLEDITVMDMLYKEGCKANYLEEMTQKEKEKEKEELMAYWQHFGIHVENKNGEMILHLSVKDIKAYILKKIRRIKNLTIEMEEGKDYSITNYFSKIQAEIKDPYSYWFTTGNSKPETEVEWLDHLISDHKSEEKVTIKLLQVFEYSV